MKHFLVILFLCFSFLGLAQSKSNTVIHVKVQEEIAPSATRLVLKALTEAEQKQARLILLELDTYGGLLLEADSIRKRIIDCKTPVYVFINKNAASAGALISLACDKIFMSPGSNIGSSTAVDQNGEVLPDKYQSYTRSIMRSTAMSHGSDTVIENGDTIIKYKRDPRIAEAMVDDRLAIPGLIDSGRIVAFTPSEAIANGYCEAEVASVKELLEMEGFGDAEVVEVKKTSLDKIIGYLAKPALQGVLVMFIFWGIFFELRSPGIGFPLAIAIIAALLYFAPLYLDGLAANWEILLFVVGLVLIGLEIFVIPGFGVAGITGILLTVSSLVLSMIRNVDFDFSTASETEISGALLVVLISLIGFIIGAFLFGRGMDRSPLFKRLILSDTLESAKTGHSISATSGTENWVGEKGIAHTSIRPIGKARIHDQIIEVKSLNEFIPEGTPIHVVGKELGYWLVEATEA